MKSLTLTPRIEALLDAYVTKDTTRNDLVAKLLTALSFQPNCAQEIQNAYTALRLETRLTDRSRSATAKSVELAVQELSAVTKQAYVSEELVLACVLAALRNTGVTTRVFGADFKTPVHACYLLQRSSMAPTPGCEGTPMKELPKKGDVVRLPLRLIDNSEVWDKKTGVWTLKESPAALWLVTSVKSKTEEWGNNWGSSSETTHTFSFRRLAEDGRTDLLVGDTKTTTATSEWGNGNKGLKPAELSYVGRMKQIWIWSDKPQP